MTNTTQLHNFITDHPTEVDHWMTELTRTRVCKTCNMWYTDEKSLGLLLCRQHCGQFQDLANKWSCCGISGSNLFNSKKIMGCVSADHNDTDDPYTETNPYVISTNDLHKLPHDMLRRIFESAKTYQHVIMGTTRVSILRFDAKSASVLNDDKYRDFFKYGRAEQFTVKNGVITHPDNSRVKYDDDAEFMKRYGNDILEKQYLHQLELMYPRK